MEKIKILVIDDVSAFRMIASKYLGTSEYEIIEAANGQEGLKALMVYNDIKLVFVDYMMPVMDGPTFVEKAQSLKKDMGFKICMMTSIGNDQGIKNCLKKGADDYLIKPVDKTTLTERAKILLEGQRPDQFASVGANFQGMIMRVDSFIPVTVTELSEGHISFESQTDLPLGAKIIFEAKALSQMMGAKTQFFMRIFSCIKEGKTTKARANFLALKDDQSKKIRSFTTKGEAINE